MDDVYIYIISNKQRKDILHVGTMQFHPNCRLDQLNLCYGVDVCSLDEYYEIDPETLEDIKLDEYLSDFKCSEYASDAYKIEYSNVINYIEQHFTEDEIVEEPEMTEEQLRRALLGMADMMGLEINDEEAYLAQMTKAMEDGVFKFGDAPTIDESLKSYLDTDTYRKLLSLEGDEKTAFLFELGASRLWNLIKQYKAEESEEFMEVLTLCHLCADYGLEQNYPLSLCFLLECQLRTISFDEYANNKTQIITEQMGTLSMASEILQDGRFEALAHVARIYALANDVENAKLYWDYYWAFINEKDERLLKINICRYIEFCFYRNEKPCSLKKYNAYLSDINDEFIQTIVEEVKPHCKFNQSEIYSMISDLVIEAFHKADESYLEELIQSKSAILTKIQMKGLSLS